MITKSIVDLNLIASFANAFEMPFVTPWFPEKTGGGFIPTTVFFPWSFSFSSSDF